MVLGIFNLYNLVEAMWIILPAYAANGLVTLVKGKRPLDFGRKLFDKRPILGAGKTIEGFVMGCVIAAFIAMVQQVAFPYLPWSWSDRPLWIVPMNPWVGFALGFGAMAGDTAGSFVKRRVGLNRGQPAPLLDQVDFLIGALFMLSLITTVRLEWFVILFVLTPVIHYAACVIGFLLKVKREPW